MDVFEYAKKMEFDGLMLYEGQLKKTADEGLRNILKMLIEQEKKHYLIFEEMGKTSKIKPSKSSFKGIKNLFEQIKENKEEFSKDELTFYRKILEIEKRSEEFYREASKKQKDKNLEKQILEIADEEHKHYVIIYNILELVDRKNTWIENAEFNHLEDY